MDDQGNRIAESRHYPYGGERWRWPAGGAFPTEYRFTGQRLTASLGLYQMGVRWYDAALGRWTSPDSIVPEPSEPQSLNRLSWVRGNPLRFVDPTGHKEEGACSDPNEECIDDEIYEAYWAYCAENPGDPACQPGDPLEAGFWFLAGVSGTFLVEDLILIGGGLLGEGIVKAIGTISSLLCKATDCGNEIKTAYQIGQEGQKRVLDWLADPTAREEVRVYVGEAGKRANYFARLDILTQTAIHEVKNAAQLSLSQGFRAQAQTYKLIADSAELELHYWLLRSAPDSVVQWLRRLGAVVHTGIPGQ